MKKIITIVLCSSFVTLMTYCSQKVEEHTQNTATDSVEFGKPAGYEGVSNGQFQEERKEVNHEIKEARDKTNKELKQDKRDVKRENRKVKKEAKEEVEKMKSEE